MAARGLCGCGGVGAKVLWGDRGVVAMGLRESCSVGTRGLVVMEGWLTWDSVVMVVIEVTAVV